MSGIKKLTELSEILSIRSLRREAELYNAYENKKINQADKCVQ